MQRYVVVRLYADPPYWITEVDDWAAEYGDKVVRWYTHRQVQMHAACERLVTDLTKKDSTFWHDGCPHAGRHVDNAVRTALPGGRYGLRKASAFQKIDVAVCSVLAHEAAGDATAAGQAATTTHYVYTA